MDADNLTVGYAVPMQSMARLDYTTFAKKKFLNTKDDIINEMKSNATGAENVQVQALEKQIKELTAQQTVLTAKSVSLKSDLAEQQKEYDTLAAKVADCTWQGGWASATKKYKCQGEYHSDAWKNQQIGWLTTYNGRIVALKQQITDNDNTLSSINTQLPKLQADLDTARTSASRAAMTPEELKNYDVAQTQAQATAEAIKTEAAAKAKASASKSKAFLIIGIVAAVAIIGGGIFWIIKRKPKAAVAPVNVAKKV